jgi:hypothetical protein
MLGAIDKGKHGPLRFGGYKNSDIETIIRVAQERKTEVNERLMVPLLRRDDQRPQVPEIPDSYDMFPQD